MQKFDGGVHSEYFLSIYFSFKYFLNDYKKLKKFYK